MLDVERPNTVYFHVPEERAQLCFGSTFIFLKKVIQIFENFIRMYNPFWSYSSLLINSFQIHSMQSFSMVSEPGVRGEDW